MRNHGGPCVIAALMKSSTPLHPNQPITLRRNAIDALVERAFVESLVVREVDPDHADLAIERGALIGAQHRSAAPCTSGAAPFG